MKPRNIIVKAITFVLFGLLIASFAIWGIGDIFRINPQQAAVAEVGKVRIEQQEFARALGREINRVSSRLGQRFDVEQARALGLVDQVVGQLVGRALIDQKIADLGLTVTEDLLKQRIVETPTFQNDAGNFDRGRFIQALQLSNLSEQEFVDSLRRDILREQLVGAINEAVPAPRTLTETLFAYREEARSARVLRIPKESIKDVPEPDEAALKAFHEEFASNFMAPEYRSITFVHLRAEDLAAEIAISENELRAEFEARRDEFGEPEQRRVAQIVYSDEEAAREAMDRFRGGANFETVAQETTGEPPVDLGLVERKALPEQLAEAAFALKEGEISEPVATELGWHILRVDEIVPGEEPTFEKARDELRQDMAMARAIDSMISIANQLDDELAAGATLDEAAEALNLKARHIEAMDRDGNDASETRISDLPPEPFLEIAFETALGEDSLLTETRDGDYFILHVNGVTPSQVRPLEEVREDVVALWRDSRQAEKAREIAAGIAERARGGESLEEIGKAEGYAVEVTEPLTRLEKDPARPYASALAGKLFDLKPGEIGTAVTPKGQIVFELVEIKAADPADQETEVAALRTSLSNAMRNDLLEQFMADLRAEYGVTINQSVIDDVLATF